MCAHQRLLQPDDGRNQCRSSSVLEYPIDEKNIVMETVHVTHSRFLPPPE